MKAKRKSSQRFEQLNRLVDNVAPSLPSPSHVAVAMVCYRHARENGAFQVSTKRIATSAAIHPRHARRILDDLEKWLVIEMTKDHTGPIPKRYRFTGRLANRDTHVPIKN